MGNLDLASNVILAPQTALAELRQRPRFLLPLVALVLGSIAVLVWYYLIVDLDWLKDSLLSANPRSDRMTAAQREQAESFMSRNFLMISGVIVSVLGIATLRLVEASYFTLAGKVTGLQISFKQWFALANWSGLPQIFGIVATAMLLAFSSTNQIGNGELAVLSLNELLLHIPLGGKGYTLASTLTVLQPWCWWLTIAGVRAWTNRSWLFCTMFVMVPILLLYSGWAAFSWR
jgi:hypothetical protein